jgi:hypothetical protein
MKQVNTSIQIQRKTDTGKIILLIFSLIFDFIGMLSFLIPILGEVMDVVWAPMSAILIFIMYRKHHGAIGGVLGFMEEIMPGADIVPMFTLMWVKKYYFSENN